MAAKKGQNTASLKGRILPLKLTIDWPYGNVENPMEDLWWYLNQHIEYDKITLKMTQDQYDEFEDDTDDETLYANAFRPLEDVTDDSVVGSRLNWLFNGKLKLDIKIKK